MSKNIIENNKRAGIFIDNIKKFHPDIKVKEEDKQRFDLTPMVREFARENLNKKKESNKKFNSGMKKVRTEVEKVTLNDF